MENVLISPTGMTKRKRGEGGYQSSVLKAVIRKSKKPYVGRMARRQVARGFVGPAGDAHYVDSTITQASVNTTPTVQHISIVPQDNTVNGRTGRAFRCKNVRVRAQISADSTAQLNTVRCMLVWDYQPNKALASFTDIFDSATPYTQPKRENDMRFKVIRDWTYVLCGNATTAVSNTRHYLDAWVKLPRDANVILTNADTTGVIGDVIQGALLFCTVGENGGTADTGLTGTARVNFTERLTGVGRVSSRMAF